jgi:hypothetical protein
MNTVRVRIEDGGSRIARVNTQIEPPSLILYPQVSIRAHSCPFL